jgi:hypothetical protein
MPEIFRTSFLTFIDYELPLLVVLPGFSEVVVSFVVPGVEVPGLDCSTGLVVLLEFDVPPVFVGTVEVLGVLVPLGLVLGLVLC